MIPTSIMLTKYYNKCLHIRKWIIAGFDINQTNYSTAYDVSRRVLFERYRTDPTICLYIMISSPLKRESSSTNLNTVPAGISRLVEFAFVIFVWLKSFLIKVDYVIMRVRFLLSLIISNLIKQSTAFKSLLFYSLRILFLILSTLSRFSIISISSINKRTNTLFPTNRLRSESAAHRPNTLNTSLII